MNPARLRRLLTLLLVLLSIAHVLRVVPLEPLDRVQAFLYDIKVRLTAPGGVDSRIVILDIDERTLATHGRWPWPRDRLAAVVRAAFERQGVALLGMDILLPEADASSGLAQLDALAAGPLRHDAAFAAALQALRPQLDHDRQLADAMARHVVVTAFHLSDGARGGANGQLPVAALPAGALPGVPLMAWPHATGNRPEFQRAAAGAGYTNALIDFDGVSRRLPLLAQHEGAVHQALGLALTRALFGNPPLQPVLAAAGGDAAPENTSLLALDIGGPRGRLRIPAGERAMVLIPFRGPPGSFQRYAVADLLDGRLPERTLQGKVALLGTSAPGLVDLRATPVHEAFPGVEVHANLLAGILDGTIKVRPAYVTGGEVLLLLAVGAFAALRLPRMSPVLATWATAALLAVLLGVELALWTRAGIDMPVAVATLLLMVLYALTAASGYIIESRGRRRLARLFGQYVPPELVDQMSRDPARYTMEGRSVDMTVLFADLRGFTALSETLAPATLAQILNEYFSAMTRVIRMHRGTLDKYVGDAIMAFWGAPVAEPRHAHAAVLACLDMQRELQAINASFRTRGLPELTASFGINSGVMTVGDMGSRDRRAYTVIGDAVNLAARLEGITAYYGVDVIIGAATRDALQDIVCRELDCVRVRGRNAPVAVFELIGRREDVDAGVLTEIESWHRCLAQYRAMDWAAARAGLDALQSGKAPRPLYARYLERIERLSTRPPPPGWGGVWSFDTK